MNNEASSSPYVSDSDDYYTENDESNEVPMTDNHFYDHYHHNYITDRSEHEIWAPFTTSHGTFEISSKGNFGVVREFDPSYAPFQRILYKPKGRPLDRYISLGNGELVDLKRAMWRAHVGIIPEGKTVEFIDLPPINIPAYYWDISNLTLSSAFSRQSY